jgi:RNA polymerase sigma-70 factor (ECF subfamily)
MSEPASDAEIARRIAESTADAASCEGELCRRFLNRARLYGLKHLRFDVTAAEDLAQQLMMILLEALRAGRVEDLERVDRFMLGTCRNVEFEGLEREGRIAGVNPMSPGQVVEVRFPPAEKLLVHRLGGSDLRRARRLDVALVDLEGGALLRFDDVPFDAGRGEVLIACQRHFADLFPHDIVFRLEVVIGDRREEASRYTVLHRA